MTVTTLARFDRLAADIVRQSANATEQGRLFEKFVQLFLKSGTAMPGFTISSERWESWARRQAGVNPTDKGIDLVASVTTPDGSRESWGIQAKFHAEKKQKVGHDPVARMIAVAQQDGVKLHRLIVVSAGDGETVHARDSRLGGTLVDVWDRPFIAKHLAAELCPDTVAGLHTVAPTQTRIRRELRPDQNLAVAALVASLDENGRTQYISACGTGKTVVSAELARRRAQFSLFAAPRLSLVEQTIETYREQYEGKVNLVVLCSDTTIGRRQRSDDDIAEISEQRLVVRDAKELAERVAGFESAFHMPQPTVVLTTYHSAGKVVEAQAAHGMPEFDLSFCDEAHYLVGASDEASLGGVLVMEPGADAAKRVRARERVYATATPRVITTIKKSRGEESGFDRMHEDRFGPRGHRYTFGEAIDDGVLSTYTLLVSTVPESLIEVADKSHVIYEGREMKREEAVAIAAIRRSREEQGLLRFVTFHRTVAAAKKFAVLANEVIGIPSASVDGSLSAAEREARLAGFDAEATDTDGFLMTNARVLTEGIDIPNLDAVVFVEPLRSPVSIAQAVGRVMRKHEGKERGYIIVPVLIPDGANDKAETVKQSDKRYENVVDVIMAMAQHDKTIADILVAGEVGTRAWNWDSDSNDAESSRVQVTNALGGRTADERAAVEEATARAMSSMKLASVTRMDMQIQSVTREAARQVAHWAEDSGLPEVSEAEADYVRGTTRVLPGPSRVVRATFASYDLEVPATIEAELS